MSSELDADVVTDPILQIDEVEFNLLLERLDALVEIEEQNQDNLADLKTEVSDYRVELSDESSQSNFTEEELELLTNIEFHLSEINESNDFINTNFQEVSIQESENNLMLQENLNDLVAYSQEDNFYNELNYETLNSIEKNVKIDEGINELSMYADLGILLILALIVIGFTFSLIKYVFNSLTRHIR